jgi:hypothetical protein
LFASSARQLHKPLRPLQPIGETAEQAHAARQPKQQVEIAFRERGDGLRILDGNR